MLLEVLLGGSDELDGNELEAVSHIRICRERRRRCIVPSVLEAGEDGADETTLGRISYKFAQEHLSLIELLALTWTPSGLMAMKLQASQDPLFFSPR